MRTVRFRPWLTGLVDAALPPQVTRTEWADTGVVDDQGVGPHTWGLVLASPAGGSVYMQFNHGAPPGGDPDDRDERIAEGEPPAPVPAVQLTPGADGKLPMRELEAWLHAVITNSGCREISSVERFSERGDDGGTHPYGIKIRWHNGGEAYGILWYRLPAGARRTPDAKYRILEAV